jgi:hypothetical protein
MKKISLLAGFFLLLLTCKGQTKNNLEIADTVIIQKTTAAQRFPGTNTFIIVAAGYVLNRPLLRFQKNENTYVQLMQIPVVSNFERKKAEMENYFNIAVSTGRLDKEHYKKEFKLGEYSALLYYGNDTKPNQEQIVLLFGDNSFVSMALGEFPADQPALRQEVLQELLSMYVDKSVTIDPTELANFSLNTRGTAFKFSKAASNFFYYAIDGEGDPLQNPFGNLIILQALPAMDRQQIKDYAISMISRCKQMGIDIPEYAGKDITLNGNYAYEITYEGNFKGKKNHAYQIVTGNQNGAVMFLGGLYDRYDELMPQIQSIAATLKLK